MHLHHEYGTLLVEHPDARELLESAREFRRLYIDPVAADLDAKLIESPHAWPSDIVRKGCDYGYLSLMIPAFLGGGGKSISHVALLMEELCAGCAGIANVFGAHYLGLSAILFSLDLNHYDRFLHEVVESEKQGVPVLFSAALTEPTAGTDVESAELLPRAKLTTSAEKVTGGYVLNGRKVFISNGSVAKHHVVICVLDKKRPLATHSGFTVSSGTAGFSVGRIESKMGQRACHAAELVFEDCFVPRENRLGVEGRGMLTTELVLAASRAPVAAIATGIARGAYETTLAFARRQRCAGRPLIEAQWVGHALSDMLAKVQAARNFYLAAARWADAAIMAPLLGRRTIDKSLAYGLGRLRRTELGMWLTASERVKQLTSRYVEQRVRARHGALALGLSSLAKFSASDLAMQVCLQGLDILGHAGAEQRFSLEKYLRDAKLTQIYEGTNQLNRHEVYKTLIRTAA